MKRVSYEIAKALKEAGYPQDETEYKYTKAGNIFVPKNRGEDEKYSECDAPYVVDTWFWLYREKGIIIEPEYCDEGWIVPMYGVQGFYKDPEEAIIASVNYLVDNDLIK